MASVPWLWQSDLCPPKRADDCPIAAPQFLVKKSESPSDKGERAVSPYAPPRFLAPVPPYGHRTGLAATSAGSIRVAPIADTQVPAAVGQDGKTYFSPRAICEGLGISWQGQHAKIMADDVLSSTVKAIVMVAADGKQRTMNMLPKEMAPGWLFTIKKVSPEVQASPAMRCLERVYPSKPTTRDTECVLLGLTSRFRGDIP